MTYQLLQSLTEVDQSLLLYLNGLHNTFGDYFMPVFTGKWIWVPMYTGILYVLLKNYNWKVTLLCLIAIPYHHICRSSLRHPYPSDRRTSPTLQSGKSDCRPGTYRQRKTGRWFRIPVLPCFQFVRLGFFPRIPVP